MKNTSQDEAAETRAATLAPYLSVSGRRVFAGSSHREEAIRNSGASGRIIPCRGVPHAGQASTFDVISAPQHPQ